MKAPGKETCSVCNATFTRKYKSFRICHGTHLFLHYKRYRPRQQVVWVCILVVVYSCPLGTGSPKVHVKFCTGSHDKSQYTPFPSLNMNAQNGGVELSSRATYKNGVRWCKLDECNNDQRLGELRNSSHIPLRDSKAITSHKNVSPCITLTRTVQ